MKKGLISLAVVASGIVAGGFGWKRAPVVYAQSLPYTLTVAWTAPVGVAPTSVYNCYLDGVVAVANVAALTCQFPVATLGAHTVGVTTFDTTFVPNESTQTQLSFTLKQPLAPTAIKVK
jgi:hypothetical protein